MAVLCRCRRGDAAEPPAGVLPGAGPARLRWLAPAAQGARWLHEPSLAPLLVCAQETQALLVPPAPGETLHSSGPQFLLLLPPAPSTPTVVTGGPQILVSPSVPVSKMGTLFKEK